MKDEMDINALIAEIEAEGELQAPKNMKSEIFDKIKVQKEKKKRQGVYTYSFKVVAAMAAALLLIFTVDMEQFATNTHIREQQVAAKQQESMEQGMKQKIEEIKKQTQTNQQNTKEQIETAEKRANESMLNNLSNDISSIGQFFGGLTDQLLNGGESNEN